MKKYRIIDAHCHIYPDKIAEKAAKSTGDFYGVGMTFDGKVSTLMSIADDAGVDRFLVHSVATTPHQVSSINRFIASAVKESSGRFIGFGTLHPDSDDIERDVEELVSLGLRGVKLHPDIQGFKLDDYRCLKIYDVIEGKLPLLLHTGDSRYDLSNPNRLRPILEIYPNLTVIAAHFGGYSVWEDAFRMLRGFPNLYVDTSSSFWKLTDDDVRRYVEGYGVDRVLFGSDYPMWSVAKELERYLSIGFSDETNEKILHGNLERLLELE